MQAISPVPVLLVSWYQRHTPVQTWFHPNIAARSHRSHEFCSRSRQKRSGLISLGPFRKRSIQLTPVRSDSKGEFGRIMCGVTLHNTTLDCSTLLMRISRICQLKSIHKLLRLTFQCGGGEIGSLLIRVAQTPTCAMFEKLESRISEMADGRNRDVAAKPFAVWGDTICTADKSNT